MHSTRFEKEGYVVQTYNNFKLIYLTEEELKHFILEELKHLIFMLFFIQVKIFVSVSKA